MDKFKISYGQLFSLAFVIMSTQVIVTGVSKDVFQDAWISIILSGIMVVVILTVYSYMLIKNPGMGLNEIIEKTFGNILGKIFILAYSLYFLYYSSLNAIHVYTVLQQSILPFTPSWAIFIPLVLLIAYSSFTGIESIGNMVKYVLIFCFVSIVSINLLVIFQNMTYKTINPEYLKPVLEVGYDKIFESSFITFSNVFGPIIVLLFIFSNVENVRKGIKTLYLSVILSTMFVAGTTILVIMLVAPKLYSNITFGYILASQTIEVIFLDRLDYVLLFIGIVFMIMRVIIFYYVGVASLRHCFKKADKKDLTIIYSLILYFLAISFKGNSFEWLKLVKDILPKYVHLPFQVGIPVLLALVVAIKSMKNKKTETI